MEANEQAAIETTPAISPMASATEAPGMDHASRMQAFEELFNSHETIPLEENPAALSDLLTEQSLEASLTDEAESLPLLALEAGADLSVAIPACATQNMEPCRGVGGPVRR